ncbi:MAG: phosphonate ABC transporter ATP-binding protein [Deltaproteobacteria bacterium]|nr:phosphonate ABC transporter ATP-binding protein [Candidatus Anaeroferrophillacea bacterium]
MAALEINTLSKRFGSTVALDRVSLRVAPGEMVALIGPSGSGKSTLLRHISGLMGAGSDGGDIDVFGRSMLRDGRPAGGARKLRAEIGFIFQQFNLVDRLSLLTNVLAGTLARTPTRRSLLRWFTVAEKRRAMEALRRVKMAEFAGQRASTLSGGQQQRGAIARAIVQQAKIVLADEPIASLDPDSSRRVMNMLAAVNREDGVTVLVTLHQVDYALRYCPRVVALREGRIVYDGAGEGLSAELLKDIYGDSFDEAGIEHASAATVEGLYVPGRQTTVPAAC